MATLQAITEFRRLFSIQTIYSIITYFKLNPYQLLRFFQLQLFITLISWPILLLWGLPLSLASPLGNLIFTPFLTSFLLLSSLIFFCEIFFIPNNYLIYLLDQLSTLWISLLAWAQRSWLLSCAQPSLYIALCLPLGALIIMHYKKATSALSSTGLLLMYTVVCFLYLRSFSLEEGTKLIPCFNKDLSLISSKDSYTLIDSGALKQRISMPNWVTYTLLPELTKYGIDKLDAVISLEPSAVVFRALTQLVTKIHVKKLYIPHWQGSLSYGGWKGWQKLLQATQNYETKLVFIYEPLSIMCGSYRITLQPSKKKIYKNKLRYTAMTLALHDKNGNK